MGGQFGENLVKTLGGAAAGYIAGGSAGAGENLRNILEGAGWSLDDLFKKPAEKAQESAQQAAPTLYEGGAAAPINELQPTPATIDPMEPLVMAGMAPLSVEPWKTQAVPAVQISPGVNAIAAPLQEVDPTPATAWDMLNQPVLREITTPEGTKTFVTERALDAYVREEFENQMFAQMYPGLVPQEPQRDAVDALMEPVEYYEHMAGRPDVSIPDDVVHKDPKSLDVPRISQRVMMGGSFIETGSLLDQVRADAAMDDIGTEAVAQAMRPTKVAPRTSRSAQKANAALVPDDQGVTLLEEFEGNEPFAYNDGAGYLTIGIGHKLTDDELNSGYVDIGGESVYWKSGLTGDQIDMLAQQDLGTASDIVRRHVKVPLKQNQFNALVSFAYNVGEGPFSTNAGFLQALNRGDEQDFLKRLQMYTRASGVVLPGLQRRRAAEAALFMAGGK